MANEEQIKTAELLHEVGEEYAKGMIRMIDVLAPNNFGTTNVLSGALMTIAKYLMHEAGSEVTVAILDGLSQSVLMVNHPAPDDGLGLAYKSGKRKHPRG